MTDRDEPLIVDTNIKKGDVNAPMSSKDHEKDPDQAKKDKKSLVVAICTVAFSIPALIGACCWPAIVLPLVGVAITTGARHAAHWITLALDVVIIGGLCIYVQYKAKERDPYPYSRWQKWGPAILCWISFPFIIADPLRHVLGDTEAWSSCERSCGQLWNDKCNWSSNEYKCMLRYGELLDPPYGHQGQCNNCTYTDTSTNTTSFVDCHDDQYDFYFTCVHDAQESMSHLSIIGVIFTICFTYFGFAIFMVGNLWNANIVEKCRDIRHKYRVLRGKSEDDDY